MFTLSAFYDAKTIMMNDKSYQFTEPLPEILDAPDKWRRPLESINYDGVVMTTQRRTRVGMPNTDRFPHDEAEPLLEPLVGMCLRKQEAEDAEKARQAAKVEADIEESRKINARRAAQDEEVHKAKLAKEQADEAQRAAARAAQAAEVERTRTPEIAGGAVDPNKAKE